MYTRLMLFAFLAVLLGVAPAAVHAWSLAEAGDVKVVGKWRLATILINDEPIEDDDIGSRIIVFYADGTMKAYDNAGDEKEDDRGTYILKGDELSMTEDGSEVTEVYKVARSDNQLSISQQLDEETKLVIVLDHVAEVEAE